MPDSRSYSLPGGRTLTVRPVGPGDLDGLADLYEGLSVEDLHNRFFSVYRPDREFLEKVATVADRGGFGLVAVVHAADDERLVAEAGYVMLPNGDGELEITVAPDWRRADMTSISDATETTTTQANGGPTREIALRVRAFLVETFLLGDDDGFADDESLLDNGIVDSTGVMEVVAFLEESFNIAIDDDELVADNLDSVERLAGFVARKLR